MVYQDLRYRTKICQPAADCSYGLEIEKIELSITFVLGSAFLMEHTDYFMVL
jgi:hypothetical protein